VITKAIQKAFEVKEKRNWLRTYWAFDIHETILKPNWNHEEIPTEFYPHARETLQMITERKDIVAILYTCSHQDHIEAYMEYFRVQQIYFDYANENPEVRNARYGCYDSKPYFNVLFDDKAGFDAHSDWEKVKYYLNQYIIE
jgi:hypothetical protein